MKLAADMWPKLIEKFEVFDWRNAKGVASAIHPSEFYDVVKVLCEFRLRRQNIVDRGGNKSAVAKYIDTSLYRRNWIEKKFDTLVMVDEIGDPSPTHKVDCFKGRVALEVEWNNKDPFFDRDLNNFRLLYDLRVIDVGVIVTRSSELDGFLNGLKLRESRFGGATTHTKKLYPKIVGGGAGGCPVLVFGIKPEAYVDD